MSKVWEALKEFDQITAQEFADYADIDRYAAHAVLNRMAGPTKTGEKRLYIATWVHAHDNARRYPRAVYMLGDKENKPKPKPNLRENRRRSEAKRQNIFRVNSVFNLAMTREKIREIRRTL